MKFLFFVIFITCSNLMMAQSKFVIPSQEEIKKYWYEQGAEISSYELKQVRYNELRIGYMVNIFVTEPFDKVKQVKSDKPMENINAIPIMKLNQIKKFNTGIYQYSLMTSSFTPMDIKGALPLKVTSSVQEWCGQVFYQLNQNEKGYQVKGFSYFESEGDLEKDLKNVYLEDGIWNQIRINPNLLKEGEFKALPSIIFLRLMHKELIEYDAIGNLKINDLTTVYKINFPDLKKNTEIEFENKYPFKIIRFTETYPRLKAFGEDKLDTNTAELKKTIYSFYWEKNNNIDAKLQVELMLDSLIKF